MRRACLAFLVAVTLGVAVTPATAGSLRAQEGPDPRLVRVFPDPGTLGTLAREVTAARDAGLPVEPLVQKALEGKSKGAPDSLVIRAVRALRGRLASAAEILGREAAEPELVAAAGALYLGVQREALARVVEQTPTEARPMALVVLGDLVSRGVDVAVANDALLSLGKAGADAATLADFRAKVELDIGTGVTPSRAARVRSRGILVRLGGGGTSPGGEPR